MAVRRRISAFLLLLCFCLCLVPCRARAASTANAAEPLSPDETCSLTLTYRCDGIDFPQLPVKLYTIAAVSADYQYTLTPAFASSHLALNGVQTAGEWNVIRSTLEMHILANDIQASYQTVTDEAGQARFEALTPGLYLAISERATQDDTRCSFDAALVSLPALDQNGRWQYQTTVACKPTVSPPTEPEKDTVYKVTKLWKGDNGNVHRPASVEVELFRNGISYQTVTLSEENHWSYSWSAKDDGADWRVAERHVPSGYTVTVEARGTSFVLTNTWTSEDPEMPTPPHTGETSHVLLYIVCMNASGILLITLGLIGKRKRV